MAAELETFESEPRPARRGPVGLVLIAGAGIAGLAAALALARRGIASHVVEKRPQFAEEGAGIQIGPNGTRILSELGVAGTLAPLAAKPEALRIMDGISGREIKRLPLGAWIEQRHGAPYWTLHRADLHGALLARARQEPLVRITAGAEALRCEWQDRGAALVTVAGASIAGDLVIGADGVWSQLRQATFPERPPPCFAGRTAMRAVIPVAALPRGIDATAVHLWMMPGAHAVNYPVRGGAEIAMVLIVEDDAGAVGWAAEVDLAAMTARAARFPDSLAALLLAAPSWRKWSLHAIPGSRLRPWAKERFALIGDAAHPVMPFLAQGGVLALEDASVLARSIAASTGDMSGALADYERRRRWRAARVARASVRNGRIYHLSGLAARARDAVLARASGEKLMRGWDWLYGWGHHT